MAAVKLTEAQGRALRIIGLRGWAATSGSGSFVGGWRNGAHTPTARRLERLGLVTVRHDGWHGSATITDAGRQWLAEHPEL